MDSEQLDYWRRVMRGQAGFNGHPQALVKLMQVSDRGNLERLRLGYPEAVTAFEEAER